MSSIFTNAITTPPLTGRTGGASFSIIIGNGAFPTRPDIWSLIDEAPLKVCLDGAADRFVATGRTPDLIIGDGDSISTELKARFADRFIAISEQETNDQTKAVLHLKAQGIKEITIVAATGQREAHTLGNISLLLDYLRMGVKARLLTDHGTFIPASGPQSFDCQIGSQISIFNFGATGFRAEGLKYPIRDFTSWWQGTLNEATESPVRIYAKGEYLVYTAYQ